MKNIIGVLSLVLCANLFGTEVYFSPSTDCENRIVKAIGDSQSEIVAAVYSINNRKIEDALLEAKKRGVKIRILTDHIQATQRTSRVLGMIDSGLEVRVHSKYKIEHNKYGVYDGKLVSTGSFNWTGAAARSNSENCIFINEQDVITKYKERFEELWNKNTADGSKNRVEKIRAKQRTLSSRRK